MKNIESSLMWMMKDLITSFIRRSMLILENTTDVIMCPTLNVFPNTGCV